jgi:hypothetical protein
MAAIGLSFVAQVLGHLVDIKRPPGLAEKHDRAL